MVQEYAILSDRVPLERQAEFDRVFRAERVAVHRHLVYLTGDPALSEDLSQEAFGRYFEQVRTGASAEIRSPRAWLLTVASNLAYNHFRAETRRSAREQLPSAAPAETDVDAVIDVREALSRLEARDRIALLLRHSGFSYAEIAEATGLAAGSVGTTLARAQRRFRDAYEGAPAGAVEKE